ncbi:radical SAM protein [Clostridiales bacterium]|nr:radical SAM protein [Clostridiales bacterium]
MNDPINGQAYLEMMLRQEKEKRPGFSGFSEYLESKARKRGIPIHGQFELTPFCNFNCKMCYVHLLPEQMNGRSVLTAGQWKELILEAWKSGMFQATLTGGECLTYPWFDEIYLYLHSLGCEVNVMTNGLLLDDNRISFFKKHPPASVQITLYGSNNDAYEKVTGRRAFSMVAENIRRVEEADLPVVLSMTPCSYLGEDALETLRFAYGTEHEVLINSMLFTPHQETGRTGTGAEADIDLYVRLYRLQAELKGKKLDDHYEGSLPEPGGPFHECAECGLQCGGGRSGFIMNWKGEMIPCNRLDMIMEYPLRDGFATAWTNLNRRAENWPRIPECDGCAYETVCRNCAANTLQFGEPGKKPEKLCERTMYFVRHGVWEIPECE